MPRGLGLTRTFQQHTTEGIRRLVVQYPCRRTLPDRRVRTTTNLSVLNWCSGRQYVSQNCSECKFKENRIAFFFISIILKVFVEHIVFFFFRKTIYLKRRPTVIRSDFRRKRSIIIGLRFIPLPPPTKKQFKSKHPSYIFSVTSDRKLFFFFYTTDLDVCRFILFAVPLDGSCHPQFYCRSRNVVIHSMHRTVCVREVFKNLRTNTIERKRRKRRLPVTRGRVDGGRTV